MNDDTAVHDGEMTAGKFGLADLVEEGAGFVSTGDESGDDGEPNRARQQHRTG